MPETLLCPWNDSFLCFYSWPSTVLGAGNELKNWGRLTSVKLQGWQMTKGKLWKFFCVLAEEYGDWPGQGGHRGEAWAEILALIIPRREKRKLPDREGFPWVRQVQGGPEGPKQKEQGLE